MTNTRWFQSLLPCLLLGALMWPGQIQAEKTSTSQPATRDPKPANSPKETKPATRTKETKPEKAAPGGFSAMPTAQRRAPKALPACKAMKPKKESLGLVGREQNCAPDGKWRLLRNWKKGKLHGRAVTWYENGNKAIEGMYHEGLQQGVWRMWYMNGRIWRLDHYQKGRRHGLSRRWHPNGQKWVHATYKDGKLHGPHTGWYPSGEPQFMGAWSQGKECGQFRAWNLEGKETKKQTFPPCPSTTPAARRTTPKKR